MADFAKIWSRTYAILDELKLLKKEAADKAPLRRASAVKIQKVFRGTLGRTRIRVKGLAALEVERVFRGHVGRKHSKRALKALNEFKAKAKWNYFVIYIQRCFRGYYSRKYRQNYASRKKYVQTIVNTAAEVREKMQQYLNAQNEVSLPFYIISS